MKSKLQAGFSLVELSVVMVIIGLIVAAIAGGSSMLHTAKLNTVISELRGIETAVENFRNKYHYWPGDFPEAENLWGTFDNPANLEGVRNGNGNETMNATNIIFDENRFAWTHMARAGFLTGKHNYDPGSSFNGVASKSFDTTYVYAFSNGNRAYQYTGFHIMAGGNFGGNYSFNSTDMYYIDKKIDDGANGISSASTGQFRTHRFYVPTANCTTGVSTDAPGTSNYMLETGAAATVGNCRINYLLGD